MRKATTTSTLCCLSLLATLLGPASAHAQDAASIPPAERIAILKAAGAMKRGTLWVVCADDPNASGARIERYDDINGDGRPDAVLVEDGSFCHGQAGMGYQVLSQQAAGDWKVMDAGSGVPEFMSERGAQGWPDLSVGGPGFCFPVLRWDGNTYALHRHAYQGRPCQRSD